MVLEIICDLLPVLIPTAVGAILTGVIPHLWKIQTRKENTKREIIQAYQKSVKRFNVIINSIAVRYYLNLSNFEDPEESESDNKLQSKINNFPLEPESLEDFKKELEYADKELNNIRDNASIFLSLIRLYSKDDTLESKFQKIQRGNIHVWSLVKKMIDSTIMEELTENIKAYERKNIDVKDLIKKFEGTIKDMKIENIPI